MEYLFGDAFIWTAAFFGIGLWIAMKLVGWSASAVALVAGAVLLAVFTTDLPLLLAQDAMMGIIVLAGIVLVAKHLYNVSVTQGAGLVALAWVIGSVLVRGFI